MTTPDEDLLLLAAACAAATLPPPEAAVEFRAIDAEAALDEGPYHGVLMQIRDNLEFARLNRIYSSGVMINTGERMEWSAPWPTCVHIRRAYVPERPKAMRVRIRIADVLMEGTAYPGNVALYVCATACGLNGHYVRPPVNLESWTALAVVTDDDSEIVLNVMGVGSFFQAAFGGFVGAAIWAQSVRREDESIDSGDVAAIQYPWPIELDGAIAATTEVPHRMIQLVSYDAGQTPTDHEEYWGAVGLWEALPASGPIHVTLIPPPPPAMTLQNLRWTAYALGYVEVWSVALEVDVIGPMVPGRDAYASNAKCADYAEQPLVAAASNLVRSRVPTWGGCPVVPRDAGVPQIGWYLTDPPDGTANTNDANPPSFAGGGADNYRPVGNALIPEMGAAGVHPQPDHRGYTACVDLLWWQTEPAGVPATWRFRLAAYTPGGALQFASDWLTVSSSNGLGQVANVGYYPLEPVVAGASIYRRTGAWRWRGMLMGTSINPWAGLARVQSVVIDWDWQDPATGSGAAGGGSPPTATPPGLTYPIEMRVEFGIPEGGFSRFHALVANVEIASLPRLIRTA